MSKVSSVFRAGLFKDKVAIVTGGGTGIGAAITQELLTLGKSSLWSNSCYFLDFCDFSPSGCNVMIASRSGEKLTQAAQSMAKICSQSGSGTLAWKQCNIRKESEVSCPRNSHCDRKPWPELQAINSR